MVGQIVHAAVQLLLVESHIGEETFLPFDPVRGGCAIGGKIGSQVSLIDGKALRGPSVCHAPEHALHLGMIGFFPAFAVGESPVSIAQPEERGAVLIGEMGMGRIGLEETVPVDGQLTGIGCAEQLSCDAV